LQLKILHYFNENCRRLLRVRTHLGKLVVVELVHVLLRQLENREAHVDRTIELHAGSPSFDAEKMLVEDVKLRKRRLGRELVFKGVHKMIYNLF